MPSFTVHSLPLFGDVIRNKSETWCFLWIGSDVISDAMKITSWDDDRGLF